MCPKWSKNVQNGHPMISQRIQKIKKLFKRGLSVKKVLKGREGHNVSKTGQKGSNRSRRVQKSPKCPKGHRVSKIVQKGPNCRKGSYRGSLIHKGNGKSAPLNNFDTFHTRFRAVLRTHDNMQMHERAYYWQT